MPPPDHLGAQISVESEPALWAAIAGAAERAGLGTPTEVVLAPGGEVAAGRSRRLRPKRRSVHLGAGLLELEDEHALEASIAGELHGSSKDQEMQHMVTTVLYGSFLAYWVAPALGAGGLPPLIEGFRRCCTAPLTEQFVLTEFGLASAAGGREGPPVIDLLRDREPVELGLARALVAGLTSGGQRASDLRRVSWEDLGMAVLAPWWAQIAASSAHAFPRGLRLVDLPAAARALDEAGRRLLEADGSTLMRIALEESEDKARHRARTALGAMLLTALVNAGWQLEELPGERTACLRADVRLEPVHELKALLVEDASDERWRRWAEEAGVSDLPLTPAHGES